MTHEPGSNTSVFREVCRMKPNPMYDWREHGQAPSHETRFPA